MQSIAPYCVYVKSAYMTFDGSRRRLALATKFFRSIRVIMNLSSSKRKGKNNSTIRLTNDGFVDGNGFVFDDDALAAQRNVFAEATRRANVVVVETVLKVRRVLHFVFERVWFRVALLVILYASIKRFLLYRQNKNKNIEMKNQQRKREFDFSVKSQRTYECLKLVAIAFCHVVLVQLANTIVIDRRNGNDQQRQQCQLGAHVNFDNHDSIVVVRASV